MNELEGKKCLFFSIGLVVSHLHGFCARSRTAKCLFRANKMFHEYCQRRSMFIDSHSNWIWWAWPIFRSIDQIHKFCIRFMHRVGSLAFARSYTHTGTGYSIRRKWLKCGRSQIGYLFIIIIEPLKGAIEYSLFFFFLIQVRYFP